MLTSNPILSNPYKLSSLEEEVEVVLSYQLLVSMFKSSVHNPFTTHRVGAKASLAN